MNSPIHLCVATPMYGGQCYGSYMGCVMHLKSICESRGWDFTFLFTPNESLITRARNKLVERFLTTDATHLLFLDGDMEFDANVMAELPTYPVDVVCGLCPKKYINWPEVKNLILNNPEVDPYLAQALTSEFCVNVFTQIDTAVSGNSLIPVKHAGTGCMMIRREVFEKLKASVPKFIDYGSDGTAPPTEKHLYFDTTIEEDSRSYLSEDYYFCTEWRKVGGIVFLAPHVRLKHIGNYTYS